MNKYRIEYDEEQKIEKLLLYRKIVKVEGETLFLDNGIELEIKGNEGCCCGAGCYKVTELNTCENAITNVEFIEDNDTKDDYDETSYKIFVLAADERIKILQVDGDDGNGYYGTGYTIYVTIKGDVE